MIIKDLLRKIYFRGGASDVPSFIAPVSRGSSALVIVGASEFGECAPAVRDFFSEMGINGKIAVIGDGIEAAEDAVIIRKRDLNWAGRPSRAKMKELAADLLISLDDGLSFTAEYIAVRSKAAMKIGRSGKTGVFSIITRGGSALESFRQMENIIKRIR